MELSTTNEKRWRRALAAKATDLFLLPVFPSQRVWLYYHNQVLDKTQLPCDREVLKRSGVKPRLLSRGQRIQGFEEEHLWIVCDLVEFRGKSWLLAREIRKEDGTPKDRLDVNRALQLHVLHAKGFHTVLPLCSWLCVNGVDRQGAAAVSKMPKSKALLESALETRRKALLSVLQGGRDHYWSSPSLFTKPRSTPYGKRRLPLLNITSLEIAPFW